ncbi:MAG: transketolase family protein [Clostridiales bacterium]|nr:transketolase family protein [Clostridiales bacterium]
MADIIKTATREAYGKALVELGEIDKNVVVLDSDLSAATKTGAFSKAFPERFFNTGIAECNMMGVAAGLAATGHTVFASTFAMFAAGRAFEQVRNTIAYPRLNVKIGATHAGISVGEDGASHQCCEDIALMRSIPGMVILNPADDVEARAAVFAAAEYDGPVYMRFGRLAVPRIFDESYKFEIGKAVILKEGTDVTIIATGLMVNEALTAAAELLKDGISAQVVNMATIKPLDAETVINCAKKTGAVVTAEEHNIIGGLGSAVCEVLSQSVPVPVLRVGVDDVFGKSGPAQELLHLFGLDAENIIKKSKLAISKKQ